MNDSNIKKMQYDLAKNFQKALKAIKAFKDISREKILETPGTSLAGYNFVFYGNPLSLPISTHVLPYTNALGVEFAIVFKKWGRTVVVTDSAITLFYPPQHNGTEFHVAGINWPNKITKALNLIGIKGVVLASDKIKDILALAVEQRVWMEIQIHDDKTRVVVLPKGINIKHVTHQKEVK